MELNTIPNAGTWDRTSDRLNQNFTKIGTEFEKIKNSTSKNKGYYDTSDDLKENVKTGTIGDKAYVGLSYPYQIWKWDGTTWYDTGHTGGEEQVDLGNYYTKEEINLLNDETDTQIEELFQKVDLIDAGLNGLDNADISDSISWSDNLWIANLKEPATNSDWATKFRHSGYIDITGYDEVKLSGLANCSSYSTSGSQKYSIAVYGDGTLIDRHQLSDGSIEKSLFPSDYSGYAKIEIVVNALKDTSSYTPRMLVSKASIAVTPAELNAVKTDVDKNASDIFDIRSALDGLDNADVSDTISWSDNLWIANMKEPATNGDWATKFRHSGYIDITGYDEVKLSGLANCSSYSTSGSQKYSIAVYGDGTLIDRHQLSDGSIEKSLFPSDYSGYAKIEIVVNALKDTSSYTPRMLVSKAGIGVNNGDKIAKRLWFSGDSLVSVIRTEFAKILAYNGYEWAKSATMGGEKSIGNLTRTGGIPARINSEFIIPSTTNPIPIDLTSSWLRSDGAYHPVGFANVLSDEVRIKGVKGILNKITSDVVGLVLYNSSKKVIAVYSGSGTVSNSSVAYARININNPQTAEAHISIGSTPVMVSDVCNIQGYVNSSGNVISDTAYLCSDFIEVDGQEIYYDGLAVANGYTFSRSEPGDEIRIGMGEYLYFEVLWENKDYPLIVLTGQNGGYENEDDLVAQLYSALQSFDKYIVLPTYLSGATDSLRQKMRAKFGNRFLDLRGYMVGSSVYDAQRWGLLDTSFGAADWDKPAGEGGPVMVNDLIHQTKLGGYVQAVLIWNKLIDLGFVVGEKVDSAQFFVE